MQFVYLDLGNHRRVANEVDYSVENEKNGVIYNEENPSLSPIVLWNTIVKQFKGIKKSIIVCRNCDFRNYDAILKLNHIFDIEIVSLEELTVNSNDTLK